MAQAHHDIRKKLGPCDILLNGAGGNHPKGTTSKTHLFEEDMAGNEEVKTFFDLDFDSVQFVFNLNFLGHPSPYSDLRQGYDRKKRMFRYQYFIHERF